MGETVGFVYGGCFSKHFVFCGKGKNGVQIGNRCFVGMINNRTRFPSRIHMNVKENHDQINNASNNETKAFIKKYTTILILAFIGLFDTILMTFGKQLESQTSLNGICRTPLCSSVSNSVYSLLFGFLPLNLIGTMTYLLLAILTNELLRKLRMNSALVNNSVTVFMQDTIVWLTLAMFIFSCYLMYVMTMILSVKCIYCIISFFVSTSLCILSITNHKFNRMSYIGTFLSVLFSILLAFTSHSINSSSPSNSIPQFQHTTAPKPMHSSQSNTQTSRQTPIKK